MATKDKSNSIPQLGLGSVHLTVSNLQRSLDFYQQVLGLQPHRERGDTVFLGAGKGDCVVLTEVPGAVKVPRRTGLYHFALLVPSRLALAHFLRNLIETQIAIQGMSDHVVSEAIYLADPDGNGIEVYRDRPQSDWYDENGTLQMGTERMDHQSVLAELDGSKSWDGMHPGTVLGHMHLHVSNLSAATNFYENVIGLDLMSSIMDSANFLSSEGYHHHVGINTWNGVGISPPPAETIGLRYFTVQLGENGELKRLMGRLVEAEMPFEEHEFGIFVRDPSQNVIMFSI